MRLEDLVGRQAHILPTHELDIEMSAIICEIKEVSREMLLRLEPPIKIGETRYEYAVASARLMHQSIKDLAEIGSLSCSVTLVPGERFDPAQPFDVSWWRGGGAAITDVVLSPGDAAL